MLCVPAHSGARALCSFIISTLLLATNELNVLVALYNVAMSLDSPRLEVNTREAACVCCVCSIKPLEVASAGKQAQQAVEFAWGHGARCITSTW